MNKNRDVAVPINDDCPPTAGLAGARASDALLEQSAAKIGVNGSFFNPLHRLSYRTARDLFPACKPSEGL